MSITHQLRDLLAAYTPQGSDSTEATTREPTGLFTCADCETTYVSTGMDDCPSCGSAVESVPTERDLGMV